MENEQNCNEAEKESKCHKDEIERLNQEKEKLEQKLINSATEIQSLQAELDRYSSSFV